MGEKGSFEIATNGVEDLAHRTELALRQTTEENLTCDPSAESESTRGPLDKLLSYKLNIARIGCISQEPDRMKTDRLGPDRIEEPDRRIRSTRESVGR